MAEKSRIVRGGQKLKNTSVAAAVEKLEPKDFSCQRYCVLEWAYTILSSWSRITERVEQRFFAVQALGVCNYYGGVIIPLLCALHNR